MTVEVVCPHCLATRTIVLENGTQQNKRVRCSTKSGGCGGLFYSKKNMVIIVPQTRTKIYQDKLSNKNEIIEGIYNIMNKYKKEIPLDILRSKKLELEAIGEMRKR